MTKQNKPTLIPKRKSHAFGKDVYLLGRDRHGDFLWLEAASWDCDWYWGFGYVETYATPPIDPEKSRDITSHSHYNGLTGKKKGKYTYHLNEVLQETVLTDDEAWKLADLMKSFYTLREAAEVFKRGGSNLSEAGNIEVVQDDYMRKRINEDMLPAIFEEVYKILQP